eukprot:XP_011679265.1 PREDICTED: CUB domain-containing protein 2-like [Strongylocentrotus purpuratus]
MSIMDIGIPSGFYVEEDPLLEAIKTHEFATKHEITGKSVVIYLNEIPSMMETCINIQARRSNTVAATKPSIVKVYRYYTPVNTCNINLSEAPGVLTSPGYPSNYPDNARCFVVIQAPTSYTVLFTFIELDIEDHFDCRYDWVGLYDGPNDGFPSLRYFCGHFPGVSMVSHGPYMTVIFSSDGSKNDRGYKASFDFVQENDGTCNAMYTTAPGEVTSPNYPFEYPEAVECVTHIQAPMGQIVSLVFFDMGIEFNDECIYDSVIVYDGAGDLAPEIGRFCGEEVPTEELISSGHDMTIVFSSDGSITSTGFRVIFNFRDAS